MGLGRGLMTVRVPSVLVVSTIAHAALFGVLARITVGPHVVPATPDGTGTSPAPAEAIDVVFLDEPDGEPPGSREQGARTRARKEGAPARTAHDMRTTTDTHVGTATGPYRGMATGSHGGTATDTHVSVATGSHDGTATGSHDGTATGSHDGTATETHAGVATATEPGGTATLQLDAQAAERIANAPHPRGAEPKVTGRLESTPGGGAVVNDAVTTMTVERDGNIKFDDKPDIDVKLELPIPHLDIEQMRRDAGKVLTDWYRGPYANTKFGPKSEVSRVIMAVPGACDSWGDTWCDDPNAPGQEQYVRKQKKTGGSLAGGPADISAWLYRKFVGDPYASRKLKLLDDTRDERVARGTAFRGDQLAHSAELMQRTLEDLWRATTDPQLRKEALFELWDDCAEPGDGGAAGAHAEPGDGGGAGARAEAGERARAMVIGWIRAKLPAGSPGAFSVEEIARFDARRASKQPFTPY